MLRRILQVNINCSNLERSLDFYRMLGFKATRLREGPNPEIDRGFGLRNSYGRGALLTVGDDPRAARIQLIEWQRPRSKARPYARLNHLGICRVVLTIRNLPKKYRELTRRGVRFISEPRPLHARAADALFACLYDPDGTVLELIEFTRRTGDRGTLAARPSPPPPNPADRAR